MNSVVTDEWRETNAAPQDARARWPGAGLNQPGLLDDERATLHGGPWFADLSNALRIAILGTARVRTVASGTLLARRGDTPSAWIGVARGALRLGSPLADGRAFTLEFIGPGQWFGDIALIDDRPLELDVVAQSAAKLLFVSKADLQRLVGHYDELGPALLKLNCQRLRYMFRRFEELQTLPLPQRLARQLQRLAVHFGRPVATGVCIGLALSQTDLAEIVGASRQRVNRTLRQLHLEGIVRLGESRLQVCDPKRLDDVAHGRCLLGEVRREELVAE